MKPKDKKKVSEDAAGKKPRNARIKKKSPTANSKTATTKTTKKNNDEIAKKEQKPKQDQKKGKQEPQGIDHKTLSGEYSTRQEKKKEDKKDTIEENNSIKKLKDYSYKNMPRIFLGIFILYSLVILLFVARTTWTSFVLLTGGAAILSYIYLHLPVDWKKHELTSSKHRGSKVNKNDNIAKIIIIIASFIFALISIQVAAPVFMPKVSLSFGETNYGYIYENYTETFGEITIDIEPPLLLIKKNNWFNTNCREYRLGYISRIKERIRLDPISIGLKNNYSEYPDFYKDIVICLNDKTNDSEIDSWKLSKISIPIGIYSRQELNIEINNEYPNISGENIIKIDWSGCDEKGCRYGIHINNKESFPILIRSLNLLLIENNTLAANQTETIIKNCKAKKLIDAFYTTDSGNPENNTSKKVPITSYNAPIKITFPVEYIESGTQKHILHFRCNETINESN